MHSCNLVCERNLQLTTVSLHVRCINSLAHTYRLSMSSHVYITSYCCLAFLSLVSLACPTCLCHLHWQGLQGSAGQCRAVQGSADQGNARQANMLWMISQTTCGGCTLLVCICVHQALVGHQLAPLTWSVALLSICLCSHGSKGCQEQGQGQGQVHWQ